MAEPSKLRVSELDFNEIRNNLKSFLKSQDKFKDYNFEGSVISSLLDVFAYNTHYNSFYLNMIANEMFLDSAVTRSGLVSLSKLLGYTPRSRVGATANVNLTITPTDAPTNIIVSKNTKFNADIDGINYTFITDKAYSGFANNQNIAVTIPNVTLVEGEPLRFTHTVDTSIENQRFVVPNRGVDHQSIKITLQESESDTRKSVYEKATDLLESNSSSNIFFIEEGTDFFTEIKFGDGVLGNDLKNGNIILIDYNLTSGILGNGANVFSVATTAGGYPSVTVTTNSPSTGGADEETLNSIRFNAPKHFSAQNRAVTKEDYRRLILREYPLAESVIVYGGEDADPPKFGTVYVGIKPRDGLFISSSIKEGIKNNIIRKYNVASITPEFVDVDFLNINLVSQIKIDTRLTQKTPQILKRNVLDTIKKYQQTSLNEFTETFRISQLSRAIDDTDASILGNDSSISLKKELIPNLTVALDYIINFSNELYHPYTNFEGTLTSTEFTFIDDFDVVRPNCKFDDDKGDVRIFRMQDGQKVIVNAIAGTIDYDSGRIQLNNFKPESFAGNSLDIKVIPLNSDLQAKNNQIILINERDVNLSLFDLSTTVETSEV